MEYSLIKGEMKMKIYVDKIPEHPKDCFFSQFKPGKTEKEDVYICNITRKICPYYKEGWTKTCPCLVEYKNSFNNCYTSISGSGSAPADWSISTSLTN